MTTTPEPVLEKILIVDDEPNVLAGYQRLLRRNFEICPVNSGANGLIALKQWGPFAVIIADYRMPEMSGLEFLCEARKRAPDTVRIMLTGQADMQVAIDAINEGSFFRFLIKPCPTELLMENILAAVHQYRLVLGERDLLENTLRGSIEVLIETLSIVNPTAFSKSSRITKLAVGMARRLKVPLLWEVECAAMLSQLGCVIVPEETLEKKYRGERLNADETDIVSKHPAMGRKLLAHIPRMENVAEAIAFQDKGYDGSGTPEGNVSGTAVPAIARILKLALDYDALLVKEETPDKVVKLLKQQLHLYDATVFQALKDEVLIGEHAEAGRAAPHAAARPADAPFKAERWSLSEVSIANLVPGMVLADNVKNKEGMLMVPRGFELNEVAIMRLTNSVRLGVIPRSVKVLQRT